GRGPKLLPIGCCPGLAHLNPSCEESGPQALQALPPRRHPRVSSIGHSRLGRLVGWTPTPLFSWYGALARGSGPVCLAVWLWTWPGWVRLLPAWRDPPPP